MQHYSILCAALFVAGCATQRPAAVAVSRAPAEKPVVRAAAATRLIETRYEIRGYRDGGDPAVRHEAHVVYRSTRVPVRIEALETVPRNEFPPVSYAPLPQGAEFEAELATQKQITADLRAIQASMAAVQQRAQSEYGALVNQTAETIKLRQRLEEEREQVKELKTKLHDNATASSAADAPAATTAAAETRW